MIEKYIVRFLEFSSEKYSYLANIPPCGEVLDIGCGDCRRLKYRTYFRSDLIHYGVDITAHGSCKKFLKEFSQLDISRQTLPFKNKAFDLVILSHVIEHIPKENIPAVFAEIRRVLKSNGYLYIEFPSEKTVHYVPGKTLKKCTLPVNTFNFYDDTTHISLYSFNEINNILTKNKFKMERHGEIHEPVKKILSPFLLIAGYLARNESLVTGTLWALVNWASYAVAQKESD